MFVFSFFRSLVKVVMVGKTVLDNFSYFIRFVINFV